MQNQFLKKLLLLFCGFFLYVTSYSQTIGGKVTDENDAPMAGVSVRVANTTKGVVTNSNGEFTLEAQQGVTIEFSFVGYLTVTRKVSGNYLTIKMAKSTDNVLSDVVVVGYATQKKVNLSGSVSTIGRKSLENRPVTNAVQALQGLSPGLVVTRSSGQPGYEGWNMNVRGISSLNGTNNPLLIVDGVEYANLTLINPDDIESISVLKEFGLISV